MSRALQGLAWGYRRVRCLLLMVLSAVAEKNPLKLYQLDVPVALSAARVVILVQLVVWAELGLRAEAGTLTWPYWTFGTVLTIALPVVDVLRKAPTREVLEFARSTFGRFGAAADRGAAGVALAVASLEAPTEAPAEGQPMPAEAVQPDPEDGD